MNKTSINTLAGTPIYYSSSAIPTAVTKVYTINYYDTYEDVPTDLIAPTTVLGQAVTLQTKSLPTVSKVRVLGTSSWITNVTYYDAKARPIYLYSKNPYLGTTDITKLQLDFTGKTLANPYHPQKNRQPDIVTIEAYDYDHAGRLLTQKQTLNSQAEELITENHYDELGQLDSKGVGGKATATTSLQTIDYTYNIRGWLKRINQPGALGAALFGFELNYNSPNLTGSTPLYNGNISETHWETANDMNLRSYAYTYDALNRLTAATDNTGNYNLNTINYDKNGNILNLQRQGHINTNATKFGIMDNLSYSYDSGNKLTKVLDSGNILFGFKDGNTTGDDYTYDANGNMTEDKNKHITKIEYNHLNLPTKITKGAESLSYKYDATGQKLEKTLFDLSSWTPTTITTQYAGNYIYENNTLKFFSQPEGYIEPTTTGFDYVYQYKDHLGNIRLSYTENTNTQEEVIFSDGLEEAVDPNWNGWDGSGNSWGHPISAFDSNFKRTGNYSGFLDDADGNSHATSTHSNQWVAIDIDEPTYYTVSAWVYLENVDNNFAGIWLFMKTNEETGYVNSVKHRKY